MEKSVNSEEQLQAQIFQWHWNNYSKDRRMLFHVQQKARNAIEGARFKAIGVVAGVSDLIHVGKTVLFLELKFETGKQREHQFEFELKVKSRGYTYAIVRTLEAAQRFIIENMVNFEA